MAIGVEAKVAAEFKLVGFKNFVRANPRSDRFPVHRFHHIEFWTGDASTAAARFCWALGMTPVAKSDLSTGNPFFSSVSLRSGDLTFVFTSPYSPSTVPPDASPSESSPLPSFSVSVFHEFIAKHGGLAVRAVALQVEDAKSAYSASVANGAIPSFLPSTLPGGSAKIAEVKLYGDVVLRYVSTDLGFSGPFLPGYQQIDSPVQLNYGLARLDHAVGNVPVLADAVRYVARFTGFHEFAEFTADDIGTADSGLNSMVLANNEESVLLPMNEPVFGTKRKSQIQTYLEHNEGAGVQHLAISTVDIFSTLREMRKRTAIGGFDFMPAAPPTYYSNLHNRVGDVLTEDQIRECEELGILVDRDDQGVLLQIFTKPVGDRPTLFLEIIQRVGCMLKDEKGKDYQKGGCGGFGKGNFAELFKSIEEYEKTLECKTSNNNNHVTSQA